MFVIIFSPRDSSTYDSDVLNGNVEVIGTLSQRSFNHSAYVLSANN
jgi:hypothetical protein